MASNDTTRKMSYYNTLIFTIIAGIVSVCLLLLLLFKDFKKYLPFIVTLEVGIFAIIATCIITIFVNESVLNKLKKQMGYQISFTSCPDYYTKRTIGDKEICSNDYVYFNDKKQPFIMKIYPIDDKSNPTKGARPLPTTHVYEYKGDEPKWEKFPLNELDSEQSFKDYSQKCAPLFSDPSEPNLQYLKGYSVIPWTTMRSKCAAARAS